MTDPVSEPTPAQMAAMLASKIVGGLGLHEITEAQLALLMEDCADALRSAQADASRAAYRDAAETVKELGPVDYTADSQAAGYNAALVLAVEAIHARASSLEGGETLRWPWKGEGGTW